jgi:hypothetical protein
MWIYAYKKPISRSTMCRTSMFFEVMTKSFQRIDKWTWKYSDYVLGTCHSIHIHLDWKGFRLFSYAVTFSPNARHRQHSTRFSFDSEHSVSMFARNTMHKSNKYCLYLNYSIEFFRMKKKLNKKANQYPSFRKRRPLASQCGHWSFW